MSLVQNKRKTEPSFVLWRVRILLSKLCVRIERKLFSEMCWEMHGLETELRTKWN